MDDTPLNGIYNYLPVSDRMASAGQPGEDELGLIAQAGFEVVINLGLPDADYALPDERGRVESLGMEYIGIPVIWEAPRIEDLDRFLEAMDREGARQVFVHCAANMRATVFIALYRILGLGWPPAQALPEIRRIWTPDVVWQRFIDRALARGRIPV